MEAYQQQQQRPSSYPSDFFVSHDAFSSIDCNDSPSKKAVIPVSNQILTTSVNDQLAMDAMKAKTISGDSRPLFSNQQCSSPNQFMNQLTDALFFDEAKQQLQQLSNKDKPLPDFDSMYFEFICNPSTSDDDDASDCGGNPSPANSDVESDNDEDENEEETTTKVNESSRKRNRRPHRMGADGMNSNSNNDDYDLSQMVYSTSPIQFTSNNDEDALSVATDDAGELLNAVELIPDIVPSVISHQYHHQDYLPLSVNEKFSSLTTTVATTASTSFHHQNQLNDLKHKGFHQQHHIHPSYMLSAPSNIISPIPSDMFHLAEEMSSDNTHPSPFSSLPSSRRSSFTSNFGLPIDETPDISRTNQIKKVQPIVDAQRSAQSSNRIIIKSGVKPHIPVASIVSSMASATVKKEHQKRGRKKQSLSVTAAKLDESEQIVKLNGPAQPEIFTCTTPGCQKVYQTAEGLRLHIRNHHEIDKRWLCLADGCGRAFVRQSDLRMHVIRMHSDVRPFPCGAKDCGKAFACHSELRRHICASHKAESDDLLKLAKLHIKDGSQQVTSLIKSLNCMEKVSKKSKNQ